MENETGEVLTVLLFMFVSSRLQADSFCLFPTFQLSPNFHETEDIFCQTNCSLVACSVKPINISHINESGVSKNCLN